MLEGARASRRLRASGLLTAEAIGRLAERHDRLLGELEAAEPGGSWTRCPTIMFIWD